ncbi:L-lactate dehydrogenase-like [Pyrus ussuriensis x Pyrus communis]|uniref:L-lactate dehydrogenase-like n=1 Tax=Pyrus ussuriensis x Pyrus communis TaxID=2448454 RepID=A0A5N5FWR9_9ROSA|nr:L-lactate dehydrogenase-like [Pyrus ussuriensis x Pyrus communis]
MRAISKDDGITDTVTINSTVTSLELTKRHAKISVIGAGNVGMAIAQTPPHPRSLAKHKSNPKPETQQPVSLESGRSRSSKPSSRTTTTPTRIRAKISISSPSRPELSSTPLRFRRYLR